MTDRKEPRTCRSTPNFPSQIKINQITIMLQMKFHPRIQSVTRNIEKSKEDNTLVILQNIIILSETNRGRTDTVSDRYRDERYSQRQIENNKRKTQSWCVCILTFQKFHWNLHRRVATCELTATHFLLYHLSCFYFDGTFPLALDPLSGFMPTKHLKGHETDNM